jgi:hypothetical protein
MVEQHSARQPQRSDEGLDARVHQTSPGWLSPGATANSPQPFDPGRFAQVCDDAAWIRSAMGDLPRYMEQVIQHIAAMGVIQTTAGGAISIREPTKVVDEVEANKREEKVKKAKW